MKKTSTMRTRAFVVDLTKIEGSGDFQCPNCGIMISPDDESEDTYVIEEVKMKKNEQLEELRVRCNNCKSTIHITGFSTL